MKERAGAGNAEARYCRPGSGNDQPAMPAEDCRTKALTLRWQNMFGFRRRVNKRERNKDGEKNRAAMDGLERGGRVHAGTSGWTSADGRGASVEAASWSFSFPVKEHQNQKSDSVQK